MMYDEKINRMNKQLFYVFLVLAVLGVGMGIVYTTLWESGKLDVPCFILSNFHVYCPACGMSHAFAHLMKGEILLSIQKNPLLILAVIIYAGYVLRQVYTCIKYRENAIYYGFPEKALKLWIILLLVYCLIKNINAIL